MDLREKIADVLLNYDGPVVYGPADTLEMAARILALPEIKEALETAANLKANQEKQRRMLGHSSQTRP